MSIRFDLEMSARNPAWVASVAPAADVFSLMRRRVGLPGECAALVWLRSGGTRLTMTGGLMDGEDAREVLVVRTSPFDLEYAVEGLRSEDGYEFSAKATASVRVVPERSEMTSFRERVLGTRGTADVERLRRFCEETVQAALASFVKARKAVELIEPTTWDAFDAQLVERFKPVGFDAGLALGHDPRVVFKSAAYEQARRSEATVAFRQKRLESEAALRTASVEAKRRHLEQLGPIVGQLRELAASDDRAGLANLLKTFDPSQRGDLLHGLYALSAGGRRTEAILVVAGDELLWFVTEGSGEPRVQGSGSRVQGEASAALKLIRRLSLGAGIGRLRSVRVVSVDNPQPEPVGKPRGTGFQPVFSGSEHGQDAPATGLPQAFPTGSKREREVWILVGAGRGVHKLDAKAESRQVYSFDAPQGMRGGVNAATILDGCLYATHSEVGLLRWRLDAPDAAERPLAEVTEGAKSVRDVQTDGAGRIWFSVDDRLVGWRPDDASAPCILSAPAEVLATLAEDGCLFAGLSDGRVLRWHLGDLETYDTVRAADGRAVQSLGWTAGGGVPRLLLADKRPGLALKAIDDPCITEYRAATPVRWGYIADDLIVGVDDARDRVLVWRPDSPSATFASVSVGRLSGHSIQDVALVCGMTV